MTDAKTSFTPGPWIAEGPDQFADYNILGPHEALAIAAVVNGEMRRMGGKSAEHEANAHLIAAAPKLYAALEREMPHLEEEYLDLLADIQEGGGPHTKRLREIDDCRQALAKASPTK